MRMVVRAGALGHTWAPTASDPVPRRLVAASPDTRRGDEPWVWQLLDLPPDDPVGPGHLAPAGARVLTLTAAGRRLDLAADPESVDATLQEVPLGAAPHALRRSPAEVVVLVALTGRTEVEGTRTLRPGDALVGAGDDEPLDLVLRADAGTSSVAVARLSPLDGRLLGWVP